MNVRRQYRVGRGPVPCVVALEGLEGRQLLASTPVTFAVIGDFGQAGQPEADVASLVKSWNPAFVATVGDNNYDYGAASTIDANIGQYYRQFIAPYKGSYGAGSADGVNHFFPALGNHDWYATGAQPYLDYFTLPGNERYYTVTQGPVQLFVLDSDSHDPDLGYVNATTSTAASTQGKWLKAQLAASTAPWKLVLFHHAAYSSSTFHGSNAWMQWPFQQWGASAVLSGHDHHYERILKNGMPYFVNGTGGDEIRDGFNPVSGSAVRYALDYGAMKVNASDASITFQFVTRAGSLVDTYTLNKTVGVPAAPTGLGAAAAGTSQINLAWGDASANETGFAIERSGDGVNFSPLATVGANVTGYSNTGLPAGTRFYYRVRALGSAGNSAWSNVAGATTQTATTGAPAAPTGLAVRNSTSVAGALDVIWTDNATNESGYKVERSTDGKTFYALAGGGANMNFYRNTGLTAGKMYYYRVYAWNAAGNSGYSNAAGAVVGASTTPTIPAAPGGLVATAASASQVNLAWADNSSNETGFRLEWSGDGATYALLANLAAGAKTYVHTGLTAGRKYYYRVQALGSAGNSGYSNVASATPQAVTQSGAPAAPTGLTVRRSTSVAGALDLFWTDNAGNESGYKVERSTDGRTFYALAGGGANMNFYRNTGLTAGKMYYYRVYAWNAAGNSAYSNVAGMVL